MQAQAWSRLVLLVLPAQAYSEQQMNLEMLQGAPSPSGSLLPGSFLQQVVTEQVPGQCQCRTGQFQGKTAGQGEKKLK